MTEFRVEWRIDIEADTPQEAAELAWATMRRPDSTACVFSVHEGPPGGPYRIPHTVVDLQPEDEDPAEASGERLG